MSLVNVYKRVLEMCKRKIDTFTYLYTQERFLNGPFRVRDLYT